MTNFFKNRLYLTLLAVSIAVSLFFYHSSVGYYFFQDDFFEINISHASSLTQYINFFTFRDDIIAYRPISLQNYFFVSSTLFGLNPIGFRFITLLLFILSAVLIVKVIGKITQEKKIGFLASSIWLTSSIHFMSITWIAAAYNIIGTFFWLLTALIFLKFLDSKTKKLYVFTIALFLLTIASFEFSVTWPAIFGFYYFFVLKNPLIKSIKLFLPFTLITILYLLLRSFLIKVPQIVEYTVTFNLDSLKALFWYSLWAFNIPEEFKKQIVDNLIFFNPVFLRDYSKLVYTSFIGAIVLFMLGVGVPLLKKSKFKSLNARTTLFLLFWFLVGIFPVLFLPNHTFSMYLTLSSIGIYSLVSYLVVKKTEVLVIPLIIIWMLTSINTLNFYKNNSWMVAAQKSAGDFSKNIKKTYPTLPQNSAVLFPLSFLPDKQALLGHHALRAIYDDPTLEIYYDKESLIQNATHGKSIYFFSKE